MKNNSNHEWLPMLLLTVSTAIRIVWHSAEVVHFHHKSCPPLCPRSVDHLHTSRGVRLGSTTRPLQSISPPLHAYRGLTINLKAHLQLTPMESSKGSPFSPYLQVAHLSGDLLIIKPGHTHIGSWLHCEACSERTTNRSLHYLSKTTTNPPCVAHYTHPSIHLLKSRFHVPKN